MLFFEAFEEISNLLFVCYFFILTNKMKVDLLFGIVNVLSLYFTVQQVSAADRCSPFGGCKGLSLVSRLPVERLGWKKDTYCTSLWGWTDSRTSKDYVITTCEPGQSVIDITDIENPVPIARIKGYAGGEFRWRDVKVYKNHAFFVTDALLSRVQVVDLEKLVDSSVPTGSLRTNNPVPPMLDHTLIYEGGGIYQSHNIEINEDSGFAYAVGGGNNCKNGLHMINIKDPKNPKFAGCFYDIQNQYIHDAKCVTYTANDLGGKYKGREICFGFAVFNLLIIDVTDKSNPKLLSRLNWPGADYIHQGWLTTDKSFLVVDDERDEPGEGIKTFIVDVRDLDVPKLGHVHVALGETFGDHNQYVLPIGEHDYTFQANYAGGIRVLRINRGPVKGKSNDEVVSLEQVAFFDTNKRNDNEMIGTWSVYPYFAEKEIVVTFDMETGFYILKRTFDDNTPAIPYKNGQATPSPTSWADCPKIKTKDECEQQSACTWDDDWVQTQGWSFGCYNGKPIKPTEPYRAPGGDPKNCLNEIPKQCNMYPACKLVGKKCEIYSPQ